MKGDSFCHFVKTGNILLFGLEKIKISTEIRGVCSNQYNIISGIALIKHLINFLDHLYKKYPQNLHK